MDDIENILNESADETLYRSISENNQSSTISAALENVAADIWSEEERDDRRKSIKPLKKSTMTILKDAAKDVNAESRQAAAEIFNSAANAIQSDDLNNVNDLSSPEKGVDELLNAINEDFDQNDEYNELFDVIEKQEENQLAPQNEVEKDEEEREVDNKINENASSDDDEVDDENEEDEEDDENQQKEADSIKFLHFCYNGQLTDVERYLDRNIVNLFYVDQHGWSCLHWTASKGHDEIMDILMKNAKRLKKLINMSEQLSGWTALHVACVEGHRECIKVLLKYGARTNIKDKFGDKPLDCISLSEKTADGRFVRKLVESYQAKEEKKRHKSKS